MQLRGIAHAQEMQSVKRDQEPENGIQPDPLPFVFEIAFQEPVGGHQDLWDTGWYRAEHHSRRQAYQGGKEDITMPDDREHSEFGKGLLHLTAGK